MEGLSNQEIVVKLYSRKLLWEAEQCEMQMVVAVRAVTTNYSVQQMGPRSAQLGVTWLCPKLPDERIVELCLRCLGIKQRKSKSPNLGTCIPSALLQCGSRPPRLRTISS